MSNVITRGYGEEIYANGLKLAFNIKPIVVKFSIEEIREKFRIDVLRLKFKIRYVND